MPAAGPLTLVMRTAQPRNQQTAHHAADEAGHDRDARSQRDAEAQR